MNTIEKLREELAEAAPEDVAVIDEIKRIKRMNYRLSDAIREGASVTKQSYNWGTGETACALTAGVIAAKARGYM